jgi:hypothetical protein
MAYPTESEKFREWLDLLARAIPMFKGRPGVGTLDVRALSDHLKRDMGFLDGVPTDKRR